MRPVKQIPGAFRQDALIFPTSQLAEMYSVTDSTINRWRRKLGIPAPARNSPYEFRGMDTPEQIQMCLECEREKCGGLCLKMKEAKGKKVDTKRGRGKILTEAQWGWIAERYREGYEASEIASFVGMSAASVRNGLKRMGITLKQRRLPPLDGRKAEFLSLG